jgi:hypothetical protein
MAASSEIQDKLLPLYAFNIEVSRAPWVTQEPMIAEMRLQWWRDALEEIANGGVVRSHEVTEPLSNLIRTQSIPVALLDQIITARRWDIYKDPFEDRDHFDEYINQTSGNLMWASMLALGGHSEMETEVRSLAYGSGVAALLQAAAELESRGRYPLVDGSPTGIKALSKEALARVHSCRQKGRKLAPALWPGYMAKPLLRMAIEQPQRVADGSLQASEFTKNWRLLRRQVFGMN